MLQAGAAALEARASCSPARAPTPTPSRCHVACATVLPSTSIASESNRPPQRVGRSAASRLLYATSCHPAAGGRSGRLPLADSGLGGHAGGPRLTGPDGHGAVPP